MEDGFLAVTFFLKNFNHFYSAGPKDASKTLTTLNLKRTMAKKGTWPEMEKTTALNVSALGVILVRIFPHLRWIQRDTEHLSVFSPNLGKYGAW